MFKLFQQALGIKVSGNVGMEVLPLQQQCHYVAMLGFGSANQELAKLILKQRKLLAQSSSGSSIQIVVNGIFTRSHGGAHTTSAVGLDLQVAVDLVESEKEKHDLGLLGAASGGTGSTGDFGVGSYSSRQRATTDEVLAHLGALAAAGRLDSLAEGIIANYEDGEPAATFARWALSRGVNYCTASKAPVALFYPELSRLAMANGCKFRFESACGDGVPIFNLARYCLPGQQVARFEGIMNTTTNVILAAMESGKTAEEGIRLAQEQGIAEADPSGDTDGFDAAVKCLCLARVLMKYEGAMKIGDIDKASLREVSADEVRVLAEEGKRIKFACTGERRGDGSVSLRVEKKVVGPGHPFYHVNGFDNIWTLYFSDLCPITLTQHVGTTRDTGYGLFADILDAAGHREHP